MTPKPTDKTLTKTEWGEAIADAEVERLLALSDEQVIEEFNADCAKEGVDPEMKLAELQARIFGLLSKKTQ